MDYPNLWPYLRDLYQHDGVAGTVNFDHINPNRIVPIGPLLELSEPHDRDRLAQQ